jgi:hypothetical protein
VREYEGEEHARMRCRRVVLDEYLDGKEMRGTEREGCEEGEEKCDVCRDEEMEVESEGEGEGDEEQEESEMNKEVDEREGLDAAEEARRVFGQQKQERQGPQQRVLRQRQQEFGEME